MSDACEDCRTLRRERSRHLVLILALVDFLYATKELSGTADFGTPGRRLVSRASRLIGLCKNELKEADEERRRLAEDPRVVALVPATLRLGTQNGDPGAQLEALDVLARGGR